MRWSCGSVSVSIDPATLSEANCLTVSKANNLITEWIHY